MTKELKEYHYDLLPKFSGLDLQDYPQNLQKILDQHLASLDDLLSQSQHFDWSSLIGLLESFEDELEKYWSPLSHLHAVVNSKALRACYQACLPKLTAYEIAISHNQRLYEALTTIERSALNSTQLKILDDALQDFVLSGIALKSEEKKRFEQIQSRLSELGNLFENHLLDATQAFHLHVSEESRLKGIPEHAVAEAKKCAEEKEIKGWLFSLEYPSYNAVVSYAEDRALRQEMYRAFVTRASEVGPHAGEYDNTEIMNEMLKLRHEKAQLLGFQNYAELSLVTKMADNTATVLTFLNDLLDRARHQAEQEGQALQDFAKNHGMSFNIEPWDVSYLSNQKKQALFNLSDESLRPYFPLPKVLEGMKTILTHLYGIHFEPVTDIDVWHPDVTCYRICDEQGLVRGYIYFDLFARPHKRGGAWMDSCQSRRCLNHGEIQPPIAFLTCNFAKAQSGKIPTLSHDEVLTLFHEMGHCLHHVLTKVNYLSAAGINGVEWDAVELPSQFFENWCWSAETLNLLSAHVDTQEPLPTVLLDNLIAAKNFQSALAMLRQIEFSLFDFLIHLEFESQSSEFIAKTLANVRQKTAIFPIAPFNRFQHGFSHIFGGGYAAGYYSYKWAEVLSADAFSRFEEEGLLNAKTGRDFLHAILEVGSSQKASEAFMKFRGREARIDALLKDCGIQETVV